MGLDEVNGVVRALLSAVGGGLVAKGVIAASWVEPVTGGVLALISIAWSIAAKKKYKVVVEK